MRKLLAIVGVTAIVLGGLFAGLTAPAFAQGTTNVPGANNYHQDGQVNLISRAANDPRVPLFDKDPSTPADDPIVMRTSTTGDLIIEVHAECFITIRQTPEGVSTVIVRVHVEVDSVPVPVAEETVDIGKVNFCDRHIANSTAPGSSDTTSNAAGFKWVAFNVQKGEHTVQAFAEFTVSPEFEGSTATIGRRLMQVFTTTTQQN